MLTKEIKYNLSTDYKRLYELLKSGNGVIGFTCSFIGAKKYIEHSKLCYMTYDKDDKFFNIGITVFESDLEETTFNEICKDYNIRFFDLNN